MKKILIIDDDVFYLKLINQILNSLHFHTTTCDNLTDAEEILTQDSFDLILTDLNFGDKDGEYLIEYIREKLEITVPLIVLSGNSCTEIEARLLELGANDYIQKPVTIKNLILKILKHLNLEIPSYLKEIENKVINEKRIGIVTPCYNEAERLESAEFQELVQKNSSYHLCFVNDGSKDNTLAHLQAIQNLNSDKISVLDLPQNSGKAEAVRQGIMYLMKEKNLDYIGFLDADLSTDFVDFDAIAKLIQTEEYDLVIGSRMTRAGAEINKESKRSIISYMINRIIVSIIKIDIKDTQCGAKIFTIPTAQILFNEKFQSRWLFDVELFIRLKNWKKTLQEHPSILEYPLKRWIHKDGSKLGYKDSLKIFLELYRISKHYRSLKNSLSTEGHTTQNSSTNAPLHNSHQPPEAN